MTDVAATLAWAEDRLTLAGVESPRVDAEILLGHVLGVTRSDLQVERMRPVGAAHEEALASLLARRERREPLAYVLGEWGFRRLTLTVDSRALVPRPETEIVVERCLALVAGIAEPRVLDVGTGSGAIALAIADEHPGARVVALDVSVEALALAAENAARTGLAVEVQLGDLFDGLPAGPWDLIVSNPPYVRDDELLALAPEVREWEPPAALVEHGHTQALVAAARGQLGPGGALVLEAHEDGAPATADLVVAHGFTSVRVTPDLTGRDRVVEGLRPVGA